MADNALPIECRARHQEIYDRAEKLFTNFVNGNRNDVAQELLDMEPKAAFAVLVLMMDTANDQTRADLIRYYVETA